MKLQRLNDVVIADEPLGDNREQGFLDDDGDIRNIYDLLNLLRSFYESPLPPVDPENGDKWIDSSSSPKVLCEWSEADSDWKVIMTLANTSSTPSRQCIVTGPAGGCLQANGLNVNLLAPITVNFAHLIYYPNFSFKDEVEVFPNNVYSAWTLPTNSTSYLYISKNTNTGAITFKSTTIAPIYSRKEPAKIEGAHWFNMVSMQVCTMGGWNDVMDVFVGYAVTTNAITELVTYPYYDWYAERPEPKVSQFADKAVTLAKLADEVTALLATKATSTGDSTTFNVARAVTSNNAMPLSQLNELVAALTIDPSAFTLIPYEFYDSGMGDYHSLGLTLKHKNGLMIHAWGSKPMAGVAVDHSVPTMPVNGTIVFPIAFASKVFAVTVTYDGVTSGESSASFMKNAVTSTTLANFVISTPSTPSGFVYFVVAIGI